MDRSPVTRDSLTCLRLKILLGRDLRVCPTRFTDKTTAWLDRNRILQPETERCCKEVLVSFATIVRRGCSCISAQLWPRAGPRVENTATPVSPMPPEKVVPGCPSYRAVGQQASRRGSTIVDFNLTGWILPKLPEAAQFCSSSFI